MKRPPPRWHAPQFFRPFEVGVLRALAAHEVTFAIIGGTAMHLHGITKRPRNDMDLLVDRGAGNEPRLLAVIEDIKARPMMPITRVQMLAEIDGIGTDDVIETAVPVATEVGCVRVMSKDHLVASKLAAWREKDISDLLALGICEPARPPNLHLRRCAKCEERRCIWNFAAGLEGAFPPLDQDGRVARHGHREALEPTL